jgi:hypothetical protein
MTEQDRRRVKKLSCISSAAKALPPTADPNKILAWATAFYEDLDARSVGPLDDRLVRPDDDADA